MELIPHGDLDQYIAGQAKPEPVARQVTAQVLAGLEVMHNIGLTHRDLKPQVRSQLTLVVAGNRNLTLGKNIFIYSVTPEIRVKIGDFGISKRTPDLKTRCYTPDYAAPELRLSDMSDRSSYTSAVDIWSLGCIVHQLLTGELPFTEQYYLSSYVRGDQSLYISTYPGKISPAAVGFIQHLLAPDADKRPTASGARELSWIASMKTEEAVTAEAVTEWKSKYENVKKECDIMKANHRKARQYFEDSVELRRKMDQKADDEALIRKQAEQVAHAELVELRGRVAQMIVERADEELARKKTEEDLRGQVSKLEKNMADDAVVKRSVDDQLDATRAEKKELRQRTTDFEKKVSEELIARNLAEHQARATQTELQDELMCELERVKELLMADYSSSLWPWPTDVPVPESRPGSPIPWFTPSDSPTLKPNDVWLPKSRSGSLHHLPDAPQDLPGLLVSPWNSPTLNASKVWLPKTSPDSPYHLPTVQHGLPKLPGSPWDSPTSGMRPTEVFLPRSCPGSPYYLPTVPDDLPSLPPSSWNSPTLGPSPSDVELPHTPPCSPYYLPRVTKSVNPLKTST